MATMADAHAFYTPYSQGERYRSRFHATAPSGMKNIDARPSTPIGFRADYAPGLRAHFHEAFIYEVR